MKLLIGLICVLLVWLGSSFRLNKGWFSSRFVRKLQSTPSIGGMDDRKEVEDMLNNIGSSLGKKMPQASSDVIDEVREMQPSFSGETFRQYPFVDLELPILQDYNNYWSGKFDEYFWHQNADQVYVYIPIDEDLKKADVSIKFDALKVTVNILGKSLLDIPCFERIIPDGCFWLIEKDKQGKRYLQLDLEKRYRMINWTDLFRTKMQNSDATASESRSKMLEKLLAANKGMSKLTGFPAETMEEMMRDPKFVDVMSSPAELEAKISLENEDGEVIEIDPEEYGINRNQLNEPINIEELEFGGNKRDGKKSEESEEDDNMDEDDGDDDDDDDDE